MQRSFRLASFPLAATLLVSAVAANDVKVVDDDPGPGVDFNTLEAALAGAAAGDILLVREGDYPMPFPGAVIVDGKPLVIVGEGAVTASGAIRIQNMGAGETFAIRGITSAEDLALDFETNAGVHWIEDCRLGHQQSGFDSAFTGFTSSTVNVLRSDFLNGSILSQVSSLSSHDSRFIGVNMGHPSGFDVPISLSAGSYFDSGSTFATALPGVYTDIFIAGGSPTIHLLEPDADDLPESVVILPGTARSYEADALVREGGTLNMTFEGQPGDQVLWLISLDPAHFILPTLKGTLQVGALVTPARVFGPIPASGTLQASLPAPFMPAGVDGLTFYSQPIFITQAFEILLGPGSMLVLLDETL